MKLGLGLSIPGVAAQGGNQGERILSTAKHLYDARRGSAFTDYGTSPTNGTATDVTHSGKWWSFNGTSSYVNLWGVASIPLTDASNAWFVVVARRTSASNPAALGSVLGYKNGTTAANAGFRITCSTTSALSLSVGDGTNSETKTSTGVALKDSTVLVTTARFTPTEIALVVNNTGMGTTSRGSVVDASPTTITTARAGANSHSVSGFLDVQIGLIAAFTSVPSAAERAVVVTSLQAAFA
jgi:hypothetical protein